MDSIKPFPMVIFADGFGLYRNMYCFLTAVYAMPSELTGAERQKSQNCYTLTLRSHGLEFNSVAMGICTGMKDLNVGCILMINRV